MTPSARTREKILDALASCQQKRVPEHIALERPEYTRKGQLSPMARAELMMERLNEYDAVVERCQSGALREIIADQLNLTATRSIVVPTGVPTEWLADGFEWRVDRDLTIQQIEESQCVLTASFCGIAGSGTIVMHHGPAEGRRVITLLPDRHICVLRIADIVEELPEYFDRLTKPPLLATYISGPSATADIEMTRIKGVHGPRFLHVLMVEDDAV
jgi:L-lactate dehydrogenase complex protein LldG